MRASYEGLGHGKLIVTGEHWVLDGVPAVALGVAQFQTRATFHPGEGDLNLHTQAKLSRAARDGAVAMLLRAAEALHIDHGGVMEVSSTVPLHRGFGSSAAFSVAICDALGRVSGRPFGRDALLAAATYVEQLVHGRSSGLDPAAASATGGVWFESQAGASALSIAATPALKRARWVVCDVGAAPSTHVAVERALAARQRMLRPELERRLRDARQASCAVRRGLERGELEALASGLRAGHEALQSLDVTDDRMERAFQRAGQAGALASKQSGAGMGGLVLSLAACHESAKSIERALNADGFSTWNLEICP